MRQPAPPAGETAGKKIGRGDMGCFVYILGSGGDAGYRTYVGWTTDLDSRLARHNAGTGARSTRGRVWTLLYAERYATRAEAMSREWHLKRDRGFRRRVAEDLAMFDIATRPADRG